jgi:hypothetical protein
MHKKRQGSLANAVLGVISSASLIVHRMDIGIAKAKKLFGKHAIKQVDRLLSNPKLQLPDCFQKTVPCVIGARKEIVVVMDWTDFDADKQATLQISLVTSHGRATSLIWKTVNKKELKNKLNDYEDELLYQFKSVLPEGAKVTVLADLDFDFIIRFRGNIKVTGAQGETRNAVDWVGAKTGERRHYVGPR